MNHLDPWRWNPVRGEYELAPPQQTPGAGEVSALQSFSRSTVFFLGATGFVGKVLLAMMLDRFPELRRLVILVRRKKAVSGEQRFYAEVLTSPPLRPTAEKLGLEPIPRRVSIGHGDLV